MDIWNFKLEGTFKKHPMASKPCTFAYLPSTKGSLLGLIAKPLPSAPESKLNNKVQFSPVPTWLAVFPVIV